MLILLEEERLATEVAAGTSTSAQSGDLRSSANWEEAACLSMTRITIRETSSSRSNHSLAACAQAKLLPVPASATTSSSCTRRRGTAAASCHASRGRTPPSPAGAATPPGKVALRQRLSAAVEACGSCHTASPTGGRRASASMRRRYLL